MQFIISIQVPGAMAGGHLAVYQSDCDLIVMIKTVYITCVWATLNLSAQISMDFEKLPCFCQCLKH